MKELNLPAYSFTVKNSKSNKTLILDEFRRRWVTLTPEEWVRQHFAMYLVNHLDYPRGRIGVEVMFRFNKLTRRADILVYNNMGDPALIVECKAPGVRIDGGVFDQIVNYNMKFNLRNIVVTNGLKHFACEATPGGEKLYRFLKSIPSYEEIASGAKNGNSKVL